MSAPFCCILWPLLIRLGSYCSLHLFFPLSMLPFFNLFTYYMTRSSITSPALTVSMRIRVEKWRFFYHAVVEGSEARKPQGFPGSLGKQLTGISDHIGLRGSFGQNHTNPRLLRSNQIGKMISLEGIVTRCSLVRPKMLKSIHYAAATQKFHSRSYHDASMIAPSSSLTGSTTVVPKDGGSAYPIL